MDWLQLLSSLIAIMLLAFAAGKMFPVPGGLTAERVLRNYRRYAPDAEPGIPLISTDTKSAILPMVESGSDIGIVTQLGDRVVCRTLLKPTEAIWKVSGNVITLSHGDYTQPSVRFSFSENDLQTATKIIEAMKGEEGKNANAA